MVFLFISADNHAHGLSKQQPIRYLESFHKQGPSGLLNCWAGKRPPIQYIHILHKHNHKSIFIACQFDVSKYARRSELQSDALDRVPMCAFHSPRGMSAVEQQEAVIHPL